ncbi:hypothetical protein [Flavobacterium sp. AG291]|uniref:hypothetical protein n=1 Tax=Flavobacterium sp. AG291 TaxID=2184000 RepID=UPI000E2C9D83|nr:hypothetical protein [Flavobacterium sp. AG291]RDI06671.1 hypothetical protein DEU42_11416 [Flavobacterium sp. AG291]
MRILYFFALLFTAMSCQTTKIKNKEYKISAATVEIGSVGTESSFSKLNYDFDTRLFPLFENKIRLDVQLLPFNKAVNKIYTAKNKVNQLPNKINYIDSLPDKPRFVTVTFLDYAGIIDELNAPHNKKVVNYLKDISKASIITSVALVLPNDQLSKMEQADSYYLINEDKTKYGILLYKDGKKIDTVDLQFSTVLAYTTGKFCWAINERHNWYIGDIVNEGTSCPGDTYSKIKEKEEVNLFKL